MSTGAQTGQSRPERGSALREAVLAAIEGTGLEAGSGGDLTGLGGSWLQPAGGDGEAGYWIRGKISASSGLPTGALLRVTYLFPSASWRDRRDGQSDIEEILDLALAGKGAGDARIIAAVGVAAVLSHQRDLARDREGH